MKTTNIISTPEITGNIGSCTSQSIEVQTGNNLFIRNFSTIVTNSCTGEVTIYKSQGIGVLSIIGVFIGIIVFIALFVTLMDKITSHENIPQQ